MDPAVVGSAQFGQIFKTTLPGNYNGAKEQVFSQPLVYTSAAMGVQYVYVATTQNNIYKLDAKTGEILLSRNLHIPFSVVDLDGCVDINPLVGITATGVIDPTTDTWYLTSKTYLDQSPTGARGKPNGRYYIHAINVNDFTENPGFPIDLEFLPARNNPLKWFTAGIHHQRPGLLHTGDYFYAGFASHCAQYNFTGWIMGWDRSGKVVEHFATEGAGVPVSVDGAGVWMSGGGIASDDAGGMFFSTGNGHASQLSTIPVAGRNPPTALEEAAVHMTINADGSLKVTDFFMPWEKQQLDGADKDLGTSPLQILPSQFSCGDVRRMGVVTGKSGKTYWLNLDNMGGYQNGPDRKDAVLQVYQNENSVYAGAGVYPLEGGYVYINIIQYPSHVFKFSCVDGVSSFTKVADTPTKNAYILGVGHGTVTSLNGKEGTGLVWISDVQGYNLRVYNAVPQDGLLREVGKWNVPGLTKFTRPVFGDGRVYLGTNQGFIYGFGAPVNLPLNCTRPAFDTLEIGGVSEAKQVTCRAAINLQVTNVTLSSADFAISSVPALPFAVKAGETFNFQAVFKPAQVGLLSSDVSVSTENSVAGYSVTTPISLQGTGRSLAPLLAISPPTASFDGVITAQQPEGVNQTVILSNQGEIALTVTNIRYSLVSNEGPWISPSGAPAAPQIGPFTLFNLPSTIAGNTEQPLIINFKSSVDGNFAAYLEFTSDGGKKNLDLVGISGSSPKALIEFQGADSVYVNYTAGKAFTFGNVTQNTSQFRKLRITNIGGAFAARLSLTVSKAPFGRSGIINANNQIDLAEGTSIGPGESASATLNCAVPKSQVNVPSYYDAANWTLALSDPAFGKQEITFECTAVSPQYAPFGADGGGLYAYVGCFREGSTNAAGSKLIKQLYGDDLNTNGKCIAGCAAAGWIFAGTKYHRECWCGNSPLIERVGEEECDFECSGDIGEICGGNGLVGNSGSYISIFADRSRLDGNGTAPPPVTGGPVVNPGVDGYSSLGCYKEASSGRALGTGKSISANATVYNCVAACKGFTYAGVEYGQECYCGNSFGVGSGPAPKEECDMLCKGNETEYCGGRSRLNVYASGVSLSSSLTESISTVSSSTNTVASSTAPTSSTSSTSTTSSTTPTSSSSSTIPRDLHPLRLGPSRLRQRNIWPHPPPRLVCFRHHDHSPMSPILR
jgi:hypothetical protein